MAALGELGRYSLLVMCKERVLKYFFKIMKDKESIMYKIFINEREFVNNTNCIPWIKSVKKLLD